MPEKMIRANYNVFFIDELPPQNLPQFVQELCLAKHFQTFRNVLLFHENICVIWTRCEMFSHRRSDRDKLFPVCLRFNVIICIALIEQVK